MGFIMYEYSDSSDTYNFIKGLPTIDILSYTMTDAIFPNYSTLELQLKPKYRDLVQTGIDEQKRPLLITLETIDNREQTVHMTFFVIQRTYTNTVTEKYVTLNCVDFDYFKSFKIIPSNINYPVGSWQYEDDAQPPEDFGKYKNNIIVKNHLITAYDTCFVNPIELSYGLVGDNAPYRKFKGLGDVEVTLESGSPFNTQKDVLLNNGTIKELEEHLYDKIPLITDTNYNLETGKVDIETREPITLQNDLIRQYTQVLERVYINNPTANLFFGYANPYYQNTLYNVETVDFTTIEEAYDLSFIAQDNMTYLNNTLLTYQKRAERERLQELIKVNVKNAFITFFAGDIADINGRRYLLRTLTETRTLDSIEINADIEILDD